MYDVAIIGLGPAGSTLARLLDPALRVIAIDKKKPGSPPQGFHKPCGGLLAPDAQRALSRFGLTLPLEVLVDPQIFSVRTIDLATGSLRHYQRFYMNLDRHRFDLWLRGLIPPKVQVLDNTRCAAISRGPDGYTLQCRREGRDTAVRARILVGADGAGSQVRRHLYPQRTIRSYLAIQQWFPHPHTSPYYSCVFDPSLTDCYAWGLSKESSFIFGGAFHPGTARGSFAAMKGKLREFGFTLDNPLRTEACLVLRPSGPADFCLGRDNGFLIGEAAGFVSPSSLEGISHAMNSALALSRVLNSRTAKPHSAYRRETLSTRLQLTAKCLKVPFMYRPALRRMVMASGLTSIDVLGDGGMWRV